MRLFYYTTEHFGLVSLRDKRIKISRFKELNDPFDFIGIATDNVADRLMLGPMRQRLNNRSGLVCMSTVWNEPLLWGHYAEKHRGMCLAFDVKDDLWEEVDYIEQRPRLADYNVDSIEKLTEENLRDLSLKKFKSWSYEQEWRYFSRLKKADFVDDNYFLPFSTDLKLVGVLFGERSNVDRAKVESILKVHPDIQVGFTRAAFSRFAVLAWRERTMSRVPKKNRIYLPKVGKPK